MHILFVCRGNVGRSQMAEALFRHEARGTIVVSSAGTKAAAPQTLAEFSPLTDNVIAYMAEEGIDVSSRVPRQVTPEMVDSADRVILIVDDSDPVPSYLEGNGKVTRWNLADPKGADLEFHRTIRNEIKERVSALARELKTE